MLLFFVSRVNFLGEGDRGCFDNFMREVAPRPRCFTNNLTVRETLVEPLLFLLLSGSDDVDADRSSVKRSTRVGPSVVTSAFPKYKKHGRVNLELYLERLFSSIS